MLGRLSRTILAALLTCAMAGAAVAFALGVHFAPDSTCKNHVSYGSKCPPVHHHKLKHSGIKGFDALRHTGGGVDLTFINHNRVKVTERLVLVVQSASGKTRRIVRVFTLAPGKSFHIHFDTGLPDISAAKVTLTVTDAQGDVRTVKRHFGNFKAPKHSHHHHHP